MKKAVVEKAVVSKTKATTSSRKLRSASELITERIAELGDWRKAVKLTFAKGAALADPKKLFNSSLEGNTRRAIDIKEGEEIDAAAFKALVRAAVAVNRAK
jgi:hypothetical protein